MNKDTQPADTAREIDPIRYEMFLHRLWAIGEEDLRDIRIEA